MSRYSIFPFSCTANAASLHLQQLDSFRLAMNAQQSSIIPGGAIDIACTHLASASPMVLMTSRDLLTFLNVCGPSSVLPFTAGIGRLQKRADDGTFLTGSDHETYTIAKGTLVPGSITASQEDPQGAVLNLGAVIMYDGSTVPIVRATGVSLASAPTPACISRYCMGPVYIDSAQIPNIMRHSVEFGVNYNAKGFNGSPYPTEGSINSRTPTLSFTSTATAIDAAVNVFLRNLGGEYRQFYQKTADGIDRLPAVGTDHIKIAAAGGTWGTDDINTSGNEDGTVTCRITPNAALSANTGSAIA